MAKILCVDDEKELAEITADRLIQMGHEVVMAEDGSQALELIMETEFDLVITDQEMPRTKGSDLVSLIRDLGLDTPIILCSGNPCLRQDQGIGPKIWIELADFLEKPYTFDQLRQATEKALRATE